MPSKPDKLDVAIEAASTNGAVRIVSLEDILTAQDLTEATVPVPEWGGAVKVGSITKKRDQELRTFATETGEFDQNKYEIALIAAGAREPEISFEQAQLLLEKNAAPVNRIVAKIIDISGLNEGAVKR